mgnify:CR=1 FL=1
MKCAVKDTKDFVEGDVQISIVKDILPGVSSRIFFIFSSAHRLTENKTGICFSKVFNYLDIF